MSRDVAQLSRLQLTTESLARLGQVARPAAGAGEKGPPDFVFYTGCNVLKTPHIALLCLDIMDALGVTYEVMGGPSHCCGVIQLRTGDTQVSGRAAESALDKLAASKTGQVISWCPSCYVQFTETTLPTIERMRGARPFEMTPFLLFLRGKIDALRPMLSRPVGMRVGLYGLGGVAGVVEAAEELLCAVPGVELIDLGLPHAGLQSSSLAALPAYRRDLQSQALATARVAGVDALVALYHTDHRELCAHEQDSPFRIMNVLEILAASMGLRQEDRFKQLKVLQEVDTILRDCQELVAQHKLDPEMARKSGAAMIAEQPVPLGGVSAS